MESKPFAEVATCIREKKNKSIGPIVAYVVNFTPMTTLSCRLGGHLMLNPEAQYSRRFLYPTCTRKMKHGRRCGKSLEFGSQCGHDSFAGGTVTDVYRFEVCLIKYATYNENATTMWCKISEAASVLLGVAAAEFREWTNDEQLEYVTDVIKQQPMCEFHVVVRDGEATAHIMTMFEPVPKRHLPLRLQPRETPAGSTLRREFFLNPIPVKFMTGKKNKGKQTVVEEPDIHPDERRSIKRFLTGDSRGELRREIMTAAGPLRRSESDCPPQYYQNASSKQAQLQLKTPEYYQRRSLSGQDSSQTEDWLTELLHTYDGFHQEHCDPMIDELLSSF